MGPLNDNYKPTTIRGDRIVRDIGSYSIGFNTFKVALLSNIGFNHSKTGGYTLVLIHDGWWMVFILWETQ